MYGRFDGIPGGKKVLKQPLSPLAEALTRLFNIPAKTTDRAPRPGRETRKNSTISSNLPSIRFESFEPRILLSGDINPAVMIEGEIGVQGEKDCYEFTVEESRRVVFDSLTNRSDLNWTLTGPDGEVVVAARAFSDSDASSSNASAYELKAGKYTITIDGKEDALGAYALRIIDATAAVPLQDGRFDFGIPREGSLERGNDTAVYSFRATAGDKFFMEMSSSGSSSNRWRLIDPYGRPEGPSREFGNLDTFSLNYSGEYLLVLEGRISNTSSLNYSFNLHKVIDSFADLSLNDWTEAHIDQPGKVANYHFSLDEAQPVLFDRLSNANYTWRLSGPKGEVISSSSFDASGYAGGYGWLYLAKGNYTLTIDPSGTTTGTYFFRLLTEAGATRIGPEDLNAGTPVSDTLDYAQGSKIYTLELNEGDKIYLQGRSLSGGKLKWRLVDPYGVQRYSSAFMTPGETLEISAAGRYWLVLDGDDSNTSTATLDYAFSVNRVPDVPETFEAGAQGVVTGNIGMAGQSVVYTFDVTEPVELVFDSHTNRADLEWQLSSAAGALITWRSFSQSVGKDVIRLAAGSYQLTVRGNKGATGEYVFRLADIVREAEPKLFGAEIEGILGSERSVLAYRFEAAAGEKIAFNVTSLTGGAATWRLINQYGRDVAGSNNLAENREAFMLSQGGSYLLLIEGNPANTQAVSFNVSLVSHGVEALPGLPAGSEELAPQTVKSGILTGKDDTKTYHFRLDEDTWFVMDTQDTTNSSVCWTLAGPAGVEISEKVLYSSDANYGGQVFRLTAGNYILTLKGASSDASFRRGSYSFQWLDAASFSQLRPELGQETSHTRVPGNSTVGYRFTAEAGETLVLKENASYSHHWTLIGPDGEIVKGMAGEVSRTTYFTPTLSGTYILLNEGAYTYSASATVSFSLATHLREVKRLGAEALNAAQAGTLAGRHAVHEYRFTLDEGMTVVFDALDTRSATANLQWRLKNEKGEVFSWRDFNAATSSLVWALPPGQYTLLLRNNTDVSTDYKFRILNRQAASVLITGDAGRVDTAVPAGETLLYRFSAAAGERFFLDGEISTYAADFMLIGPDGKQVVSNGIPTFSTEMDREFSLPLAGEYLLVLYPSSETRTQPGSAKFTLHRLTVTDKPFSLDNHFSEQIAQPCESIRYRFTLTEPTRLMLELLESTNAYWSLTGPRGSEISTFNGDKFLDLPVGDYELVFHAEGTHTGTFAFRLSDLDAATEVAPDQPVEVGQEEGAHFYRIEVASDGTYVLDVTNPDYLDLSWTLYNRYGTSREGWNGGFYSDSGDLSLAAGIYYLRIDNLENSGVSFTLKPKQIQAMALADQASVTGAFSGQGVQEYRYEFSVASPTVAFVEFLQLSAHVRWGLLFSDGSSVPSFSYSKTQWPLYAGNYVLRVYQSEVDAAGTFSFDFANLGVAPALPDGPQHAAFTADERLKVHVFEAEAGESFAYLGDTLEGDSAAEVLLFDEYGNVLFSSDAGRSAGYAFVRGGRYFMLLRTQGPLQLRYSAFMREPLPAVDVDVRQDEVTGTVESANQYHFYHFTVSGLNSLFLESEGNNAHLRWQIMQEGETLDEAAWQQGTAPMVLTRGAYVLAVTSIDGSDVAYRYRFAFQGAPQKTSGNVVEGTFPAAGGYAVYELQIEEGKLLLDSLGGDVNWTLFLADSSYLLPWEKGTGSQALGWLEEGRYYLAVHGQAASQEIRYCLRIAPEPLPVFEVGDVVTGILDHDYWQPYAYRFLLQQGSFVLLDELQDEVSSWSIKDQFGETIEYGWFEENVDGQRLFWLPAGEYQFNVSFHGRSETFAFRLLTLDQAQGQAFTGYDNPIQGRLDIGSEAVFHAFEGQAGDRVLLSFSSDSGDLIGRLLGPDGKFYDLYGEEVVLRQTGRYWILLEGPSYHPTPIDYTLGVQYLGHEALPGGNPLPFDQQVTAFVAAGEETVYRLTLDSYTVLSLAGLVEGDGWLDWMLVNSAGELEWSANELGEAAWDEYGSGQVYSLAAGEYALILQNNRDNDLSARFMMQSSAQPTPPDGMLDPAASRIYRLQLAAGETVVFRDDSQNWRLFGPFNGLYRAPYAFSYGEVRSFTASVGGEYLFVLDGAGPDPDEWYTLQFLEEHGNSGNLVLSTPITAELGIGARDVYSFQVGAPGRFLLNCQALYGDRFQWSLQRDGQSIASGETYNYVKDAPLWLDLAEGDYQLVLSMPDSNGEINLMGYCVELVDYEAASTLTPGQQTIIPAGDPGKLSVMHFEWTHGDVLTYMPGNENASNALWWLFDAYGNALCDAQDSGQSAMLKGMTAGETYYLAWWGNEAVESTFTLDAARPQVLDFDNEYSGSLNEDLLFQFRVDKDQMVVFDSYGTPNSFYWELFNEQGEYVFGNSHGGTDELRFLIAGNYYLKLSRGNYSSLQANYRFAVRSQAGASSLVFNETTSGTPEAYGVSHLYCFEGRAGESYSFSNFYMGSASSYNGDLQLYGPDGEYLFRGANSTSNFRKDIYLTKSGVYTLVVGNQKDYAYSFRAGKADMSALMLDAECSGTLQSSERQCYTFRLDRPEMLVFDSLTNSGLKWSLRNLTTDTTVFDSAMSASDYAGLLESGEYVLTLDNSGSSYTQSFSFRVHSAAQSFTPIETGTQVDTVMAPERGAQVFTFDVEPGERYYFDALLAYSEPFASLDSSSPLVYWTLLGPDGKAVFNHASMGSISRESVSGGYRYRFTGVDKEPALFAQGGTYTLILETDNTVTKPSVAKVSFQIVKVPETVPEILDDLVVHPAPDLVVRDVLLEPSEGLTTGSEVLVKWCVANDGNLPATGPWNDRIVVTNRDGTVILDITDQFPGGTGIDAQGSLWRSRLIRLPAGEFAAGELSITVITDADNAVRESNARGNAESNNAHTVTTEVTLADYVDLAVEDFEINPDGGFSPGEEVTVTWTTRNRGSANVDGPWTERLEIYNLSLSDSEPVAVITISGDMNDVLLFNDNGYLERVATFAWPAGVSASGNFIVRIMVDTANEIVEPDKANNSAELLRAVGPDMQVVGLQVLTPETEICAGGEVTISWKDWNSGTSATGAAFHDLIQVLNEDGVVVKEWELVYDPYQDGHIEAGGLRERSFTFRLPDGLRGTGNLVLRVTADQNLAGLGVLFETNLNNDAEENNSSSVSIVSAAGRYADLKVGSVTVPEQGVSGGLIEVSWTVENNGEADANENWYDQIILRANGRDDIVIGSVARPRGLNPGESYTQTAVVTLPGYPAGQYSIFVRTDSGHQVTEPDTRADNDSAPRPILLEKGRVDLTVVSVDVVDEASSGDSISVRWTVENLGNAATDLAFWNDRIVLSASGNFNDSANIILAGSVTHAGILQANGSYTAEAVITLPRDLSGDYFILVRTDVNNHSGDVDRDNNTGASIHKLRVSLSKVPDLIVDVGSIIAPEVLYPGSSGTLRYTVKNVGEAATNSAWRDRIYLRNESCTQKWEVASYLATDKLSINGSVERKINFDLSKFGLPEGNYYWVIETNTEKTIYEREGEHNNTAVSPRTVRILRADLAVSGISANPQVTGGDEFTVNWTVTNHGNDALGGWTDTVYLVREEDGERIEAGKRHYDGNLAGGERYEGSLTFIVPIDLQGQYRIEVVTNTNGSVDESDTANNSASRALAINVPDHADLAVSILEAPERVIGDPARVTVKWRVDNLGERGRMDGWVDRIVLVSETGTGKEYYFDAPRHEGGLDAGGFYEREMELLLPPETWGRFKLYVYTDFGGEVFENGLRANNVAIGAQTIDIMPKAYADLQVTGITVDGLNSEGKAESGKTLSVTWTVENKGIGITDSSAWTDVLWLSTDSQGKDVAAVFSTARHIGRLSHTTDDDGQTWYSRTVQITLPEGLEAENYFINVLTAGTERGLNVAGGPFEFLHTDNNHNSAFIQIALSDSPDLVVDEVKLPADGTAEEGAFCEISWKVRNDSPVDAVGRWTDTVWLVPNDPNGQKISLGSFTYTAGLGGGHSYERKEQVRLPSKIQGSYRVEVITNADGGIYEHDLKANNNKRLSDGELTVTMLPRPDLQVTSVTGPTGRIAAGTAVAISYTVENFGGVSANGKWKDRVYLSLNGKLDASSVLLGEFDNPSSLSSPLDDEENSSYTFDTPAFDIPLRYAGTVYLIVVADGNRQVDEYPNENNNERIFEIDIEGADMADLVMEEVTAPDQGIHGGYITVGYTVVNNGRATTFGDTHDVDSWTDTVWLCRDQTRPGANKGDILLGSFKHEGKLGTEAGNPDLPNFYENTVRVQIPEGLRSGEYFITVWSDTYDVILENTLSSNPGSGGGSVDVEHNNYRAKAISILGLTAPDLALVELVAPPTQSAGEDYTFSYTVRNNGDYFSGKWVDRYYLADSEDRATATIWWDLGEFRQEMALGHGQEYTIEQTIKLAPSLRGLYLIVQTDALGQIEDLDKSNNTRAVASTVTQSNIADLRIENITVTPGATDGQHYSSSQSTVTWTVRNHGDDVWAGTKSWRDVVYISRDPEFIPTRATRIGSLEHANVVPLKAGEAYTASLSVTLPAGAEGIWYIYVVTDGNHDNGNKPMDRIQREIASGGSNAEALDLYSGMKTGAGSVFEGESNHNNIERAQLDIVFCEPDLRVDWIEVEGLDPNVGVQSGEEVTVTWQVTNHGGRETVASGWYDGIYLSTDGSLDGLDYALVDRGSEIERALAVKSVSVAQQDEDGRWHNLRPGDSYTVTVTFRLPESIEGDFHLIVKCDTDTIKSRTPYLAGLDPAQAVSNIRPGEPALPGVEGGIGDAVPEFQHEANNTEVMALKVTLAPPPDLTVASVTVPEEVYGGRPITVNYTVHNGGGDVPRGQGEWYDMVFLSRDENLDITRDTFLGYYRHTGGLGGGESYAKELSFTVPKGLDGPYYVFVITDPAYAFGADQYGKVREGGREQNNALHAVQPVRVEAPPLADLVVENIQIETSSAETGDEIKITYTVQNQSEELAYGNWTDAIYLSRTTESGREDILLDRVVHRGGLAGREGERTASYSKEIWVKLPPVAEGGWHITVRTDIYNEVAEGSGEKNNTMVSPSVVAVTVPELKAGQGQTLKLNPGESHLYKIYAEPGETLRVSLDALAEQGDNRLYVRYEDVPSAAFYDAAYGVPMAPDQEATIGHTKPGWYYILVYTDSGEANVGATLRAEKMPLSITRITPDQGGVGDDDHRWVTIDVFGAQFDAGAHVKLARPGVYEIEPSRWQVLDGTHIRGDIRPAQCAAGSVRCDRHQSGRGPGRGGAMLSRRARHRGGSRDRHRRFVSHRTRRGRTVHGHLVQLDQRRHALRAFRSRRARNGRQQVPAGGSQPAVLPVQPQRRRPARRGHAGQRRQHPAVRPDADRRHVAHRHPVGRAGQHPEPQRDQPGPGLCLRHAGGRLGELHLLDHDLSGPKGMARPRLRGTARPAVPAVPAMAGRRQAR